MTHRPGILLVVEPFGAMLGARLEALGVEVTTHGCGGEGARTFDAVVASAGSIEVGRAEAERAGEGTLLIALVRDDREERECSDAGVALCVRVDASGQDARLIVETLARRRAEQEVRALRGESDEFMYLVSHDLSSPLISVLGYLTHTRMAFEGGDTSGAGELVTLAEREAMRLSERIEGLRSLSRVSLGREPATELDTHALVEQAWAVVSSRRPDVGVGLCVEPGLARLHGEAHALRALLEALLENALVHGCEDGAGEVRVGACVRDGETVFTVSDPGGCLDPKHRERVFGLFIQIRNETGCGVGLTLARRVAGLYGGRVWLEAGEPAGCRACFTLPACAHPGAARAVAG